MSEVGYTVSTNSNASGRNTPLVLVLNDQGGGVMSVSYDKTSTLRAETKHHEPVVLVYDARGNGGGGVCPTITGDHQNRITDYTAIVVQTPHLRTGDTQKGSELSEQTAGT